MRVMSAVTAMPVPRYSPRAPAVFPTAVSSTARSTATLIWQSGRANRSTSIRPSAIRSSSDALAVRSKNVGIGGRGWGLGTGNASSTFSPSSADARARSSSASGSGFAVVVPATPIRPLDRTRRLRPASSEMPAALSRPDSKATAVCSSRRHSASAPSTLRRALSSSRSIIRHRRSALLRCARVALLRSPAMGIGRLFRNHRPFDSR